MAHLPSHRFSVAPMMDCTDRHARYFMRLLSRHTRLYTEMVTVQALVCGDPARALAHHPDEHPLALQLGGSEPTLLSQAAALGAQWGFDEINLNVGCPSDRVRGGRFGACLMAEPARVAEGIAAMQSAVEIPVTVKTRIGIDELDSYDHLAQFVDRVAGNGCQTFIIHARKAWLQGLSPRENREVPPLRYDRVYQLKVDFPQLTIILNGGVDTLDQAEAQLSRIDGVMLGRAAYHNPYLLAAVDQRLFDPTAAVADRQRVLHQFLAYAQDQLDAGVPLQQLTRHILGLFQGLPGARRWRRHLSEYAPRAGAGVEVIEQAARPVLGDAWLSPSAA